MKILSSNLIKKNDEFTIKNEPISSIDLMERASQTFVNTFVKVFNKTHPIHIFCGPGNNGGDGLAVARLLHQQSYSIQVYLLNITAKYSKDYLINKDRIKGLSIDLIEINSETDLNSKTINGVIIDAIFGYGLNKPLVGLTNHVVSFINQQSVKVISVDVPSGLFADKQTKGNAIQADFVYTFQYPKLAFLLPSNSTFIKAWQVLDIGLLEDTSNGINSDYKYIELQDIKPVFKTRNKFSHKGTYGHLLLIAGSEGKVGAAILAAKAALRSGVGLLTIFIRKDLVPILQIAVPEAMCLIISDKKLIEHLKKNPYSAIAIGPGLGQENDTTALFKSIINTAKKPLVIDADGLNTLSKHPKLLSELPTNSILTPHPGEFKRLVGEWKNDFDKLELLKQFAEKYNVIVVLKGAYTCICNSNGKMFFNSTGNSGMATAGSGDTLTGIIASLLAQQYTPLDATKLGVYVHGLAGDIAITLSHKNALIASDITKSLGKAFSQLDKNED